MYSLDKHPYFTPYVDPVSGVKSYVLTERAAAVQQSLYFTQACVSPDGEYLWFKCANPPLMAHTYAVVGLNPDKPFLRYFPNCGYTQTGSGYCGMTHEGDGILFAAYHTVYKLTPDGTVTPLLKLDHDFVHGRPVGRLFTHASTSCDGKELVMDMEIGGRYYIGIGELETGRIRILESFGRNYNHAQFSPTKKDLFLLDQDWWYDQNSGEYFPIHNRIWLMNSSGTLFEPLIPKQLYGKDGSEISHDFWSKDGMLCWTDYNLGAYECDVDTREINHVWKRSLCHSHASADRKYWCADESPYRWAAEPCKVLFLNRATGKEAEIFSALPDPAIKPRWYHIDPHPQFCGGDEMIVSTTTALGKVDVAVTPVRQLIEITG